MITTILKVDSFLDKSQIQYQNYLPTLSVILQFLGNKIENYFYYYFSLINLVRTDSNKWFLFQFGLSCGN